MMLCILAVVERSITLNSDSETLRNFVTIRIFCYVMELLIEGNNTSNIVNIGSDKTHTIGEMATKIQSNCLSVLGFEPPIIFKQKPSMSKNSFDSQTNHLDSLVFKFANDFDIEIKELIHFCKESFSHG